MIGVTYDHEFETLIVPPPHPSLGYPYLLPPGREVLDPPDWVIEAAREHPECSVRDVNEM